MNRRDWIELVALICGIFGLTFVVSVPLIYLANLGHKRVCTDLTAKMDVSHSYTFWTGCMIEVRGQWIPLKNYRVVEN